MKYKILIILVFTFSLINAQINFVANGSFEQKSQCPFLDSQINFCVSWQNPSIGTSATPDFFSSCQSNLFAGVPQNYGGYQNPRTGGNYSGIVSFYLSTPNIREYIETTLIDTLERKKKYLVEFFVNLCDSSVFACNNFGAYLSDTLISYNSNTALNFIPQIQNTSQQLTNKVNWTKISGTYIAKGGEKYITIGNFNSMLDLDTVVLANLSNLWPIGKFAYYYIDDVSITLYDSTIAVNELKAKNQIEIFPNPVASMLHFKNLDLIQSTILKIENMFGQMIIEAELKENEINVADLLPGLYFLKIKNEQGYKVAKFLKE